MTMKTPEQWLDENDPAWQDVCGEQPVLTKEIVASIQADARAEAESERDKALAAAGEMRAALEMWRCGTCGGTQKFTPECQGCLSGEGPCTCGQEEEQACPQCCASDMPGLTKEYAALEHALSTDCGKGWLSPEKAKELEELRIMQLAGISTASIQNTEATKKDRIDRSNPYWTQAYEDVCVAVDREIKWREQVKLLVEALERLRNELMRRGVVDLQRECEDALAAVKQP